METAACVVSVVAIITNLSTFASAKIRFFFDMEAKFCFFILPGSLLFGLVVMESVGLLFF